MKRRSKKHGSVFLSRLTRSRGLNAREANRIVGLDVNTGTFEFQADAEERDRWMMLEHTEWLLDFIQQSGQSPAPMDPGRHWYSLSSFVAGGINIWNDKMRHREGNPPKPSLKELGSLRKEISVATTKFVLNREPWEVRPGPGFVRRLAWGMGPAGGQKNYPIASFIGGDWQTRFKLRAIQLLENEGANIRQCERPACRRLFLIHDKRQRFCSELCANTSRMDKFKGKRTGPNRK